MVRPVAWISLACLLLGARPASAKGIVVRFLANPSGDSVARYDVHRSIVAGEDGPAIGSILPEAGLDTLRYPDAFAEKGIAYYYSVRAVGTQGEESELSDQSEAGVPRLALPDTLRPDLSGSTRFQLAAAAAPLRGAPLSLSASDSARFPFQYDSASRRVEFRSISGRADTGYVVLRAAYFGKFEDRDTVLVIVAGTPTVAAHRNLAPAASGRARHGLRSGVIGFPTPLGRRDARGRLLRAETINSK